MLYQLAVLCCITTVLGALLDVVERASDIDEGVYTNVALKKTTSQSTTKNNGASGRAVDGNDGTHWNTQSCTHTYRNAIEYWEVDLGKNYAVDFIEIYGRTDCCSRRIQGAKLTLGGKQIATLNDMGKTNNPEKITVDGTVGRKIRIQVSQQILTLCEVKVWVKTAELDAEPATVYVDRSQYVDEKKYIDVAFEQKTSQATTGWGGVSSRAVDGDVDNQNWNNAGCSGTNQNPSWWEVKLGRVYPIAEVRVYGRTDAQTERLAGAKVYFGRSLCGFLTDNKKKPGYDSITCADSGHGNATKVRIELSGRYLTLCSVQVLVKTEDVKAVLASEEELPTPVYYGELVNGMYNVAQDKNTTQSTPAMHGGVASRVVDGEPGRLAWNENSCSHTNTRSGKSWWQVDLGKVYDIEEVLVYGRTDSAAQYAGSKVYIGDNVCGILADMKQQAEPNKIRCEEESLNRGRYVKVEQMSEYMVLCEVQVLVKQEDIDVKEELATVTPAEGLYNVARGKKAKQSSTGWSSPAWKAVDGWGDVSKTQWSEGSCSHTKTNVGSQWWMVDLGTVYRVQNIEFYGRTDGNSDQYSGAKVYLGHTLCGTLVDMGNAGGANNLTCGGNATGRVVRVEQLNKYLTVCELKVMVKAEDLEEDEESTVMPQYTNVAKGKVTSQSSTQSDGVSSRAVDGWEDATAWNLGSCTYTDAGVLNWWKVELGETVNIHSILISGRSDCCQERLKGAIITVDGQTVARLHYFKGQKKWTIPLNNMNGSEIRISKRNERLTLCEVQVIVDNEYDLSTEPAPCTLTNIAEGKPASSSGSFDGGTADLANDGDTEANLYRGSCSMTGPTQGDSWWSVDLGKTHKIGLVQIYARLDDKQSHTINTASVRVGDHFCGSISYSENQIMYSVNCEGAEGDKVTLSKLAFLSLCEVQVFEFQF